MSPGIASTTPTISIPLILGGGGIRRNRRIQVLEGAPARLEVWNRAWKVGACLEGAVPVDDQARALAGPPGIHFSFAYS
jgi:hypothetical protein